LQLSRNTTVKDRPLWLPESIRSRSKRLGGRFRIPVAVRRVCKRRKKIPVSDWAVRHRYITRGPLEGTRFKRGTVAYANGVMDASFYPSVEEIVLCFADQSAKSFIMDTCIGYIVDRAPGPVLYVYPDEDTATENSKDRILPMLSMSPRLRSYLTGAADDEAAKRINLRHMQIYMAWASSAIKLANKSIKYLVEDEVDKYPVTAGKREADPRSKAQKRTRAFKYLGRKKWTGSTPTVETGPIWTALNACQVIFDYHVICPDCGHCHRMEFNSIKWPDRAEGEERIKQAERIENENLACYVCPGCGSCWSDLKRDAAVRWGLWKSREGDIELFEYIRKYEPKKIGFHLPSWVSRFVGISEVAAAFLHGLVDRNKFKDFKNSHEAVPWLSYTIERKEDRILALKDDRPSGIVPSGGVVSCLLAGIDTQDDGFWYEIRAFGFGESLASWQVRAGFVTAFEDLEQVILTTEYKDRDGAIHRVQMAAHDAMGHRTSAVYNFTRRHRGLILPFQGKDRMTQPYTFSNIEFYPGSKIPIPGGLRLLKADVTYFKNQLAGKLEIAADDPGAWRYNADTTEEWARQMCAEYQDEKGLWQCPSGRANHAWDCAVLCLVAAEVVGVRYSSREKRQQNAAGTKKPTKGAGRRW